MKYLIEMQPGGTRALAFGLSWHTTLGNDPDVVAAKIAAREKAVAYTRGGARSTVVGLLRTRKRTELPGGRVELFSAAAVFARAFARGPVALRMAIPGGIWLCAAFDGVVVLGTDVIYGTPQQAQAHLAQLRERYRGLTVYGDADEERKLPANALASQLDASTQLRRTTRRFAQVPVLAWGLLAALAAWLAAYYGHGLYQESQHARRDAERHSAPLVDPVASWQAAIAGWAGQTPDHGGPVLRILLDAIEQAPLSAGRWELADIDCIPASWRCTARYKRAHLGTNQELRTALSSAWAVHWPDLQTAIAQQTLPPPAATQTLRLETLPADTDLALSWSSAWQRLSPALADLALGDRAAVAVAPPTEIRADGTTAAIALPRDPRVRLPVARNLIVNGPMRSLYLLALPSGATIERLQVRRMSGAHAGLGASALTATLTGKIHAY